MRKAVDTTERWSLSFAPLFKTAMGTFSAKATEVKPQWWVIDAADQVLGRVAVKAANLLRGKEKAIYTPHVDTGDFVIVINAEKVRVTGKKEVAEDLHELLRLRRRPQERDREGPPRPPPRAAHRARGEGHDSAQSSRPPRLHQAESLRRARSIRTSRSSRSP